MGFLDAIFHVASISMVEAHREVRKEEKQEKDTFTYCLDVQDSLNNLLERTGSPAFYVANTRQANSEINKMQHWKQSYEEYLSLGGIAEIIENIEDIDVELRFVKILSSNGKASEQNKYRNALDEYGINTSSISYPTMTFSREGIIRSFSCSGINKEDAAHFIDQYNINWEKHAIVSAQNYIRVGLGKTKERLIHSLTLDGFTEKQIKKAVDACWND